MNLRPGSWLVAGWLAAGWACSNVRDPPPSGGGPQTPASAAAILPLDSILAQGQERYDQSEYDAARDIWTAALDRARAESNLTVESRLLTSLALTQRQLGDFTEAQRLAESALELERQHRLTELIPRSLNTLGLIAWDQGRLNEAVEIYQQTVAAAQAVGNARYVYIPAGNLGSVYTQFGEFATARQYLMTGLQSAREHSDLRTEGRVLTNLAVLELRVGDVSGAQRWLEAARAVARAAEDATNEETILGQLVDVYATLGEPGRAFAVLDSALRQARAQGRRQAEAANLELQSALYRQAGDLKRALDVYAKARAINRELGLREETGRDLRNEAEIYLTLGNLDLAARFALEALAIHREIGARPAEHADLIVLAELAEARGDRTQADRHLTAARALTVALDARGARVDAALAEARVLDRRGESRRLLRVLDGISDDLLLSGYTTEWEAQALRARAHARLGDLVRAAAEGRRAVAAVERVRGNFGSGALRTSYVADKRRAFSDLVGVLIGLGRIAEALEVADAARSRVLLEHGALNTSWGAGGAYAEREELLRRIEGLASDLAEAEAYGEAALGAELAARLGKAREEYEAFAVGAAERAGSAAALLGGDGLDESAVRSALAPDEVLIEYLVAPDQVIAFVLAAGELRSFTRAIAEADLAGRVRLARDLLADPNTDPRQADAVLGTLHDLLFRAPLASGLLDGARRLIVVSHGSLTYLPFSALRDPRRGRYLIEDYSLLSVPSAAALASLRHSRLAESPPDAPLATVVFAPLPGALPASRAEARAAARAAGKAQVHMGRRATEARLRAALASGSVVHVASHGVMNAASPMFSRIELAQRDEPVPGDDGRLEVHEVLGLSIWSPLVFLSGCETGLGKSWSTGFAQGEDYATLAQAFLFAGARNVIATLWPVEDQGAAEFAALFYERLSELGPAEALAQAQRALRRGSPFRHPYYWSAYRISGDGELDRTRQNLARASVSQSGWALPLSRGGRR